MIDPILPLVFATALALLFGMAAQHKLGLLKNKRFAAQLQAYQLLPEVMVAPAARALPWLELAVAFCLLIPQTRPAAALLGAALLLLYAAAMAVNLLRGLKDIDCGCGDAPQKLSWFIVARNILLALFALLPLAPTFANAPVAIRADDLVAGGVEVAFVGIPQSFSSGWRDSQNAPRILRGMYGLGGFDIYAGIDPALELSIADYGNIWVDYMSVELSVNHVREQVGSIVAAGAVPFIVGGDHSVMFPTVAAMADQHGADNIGVVHLDAHYGGARDLAHWYSDHQSVARLIAEDLLDGSKLIQLGLRGPEHDAAALQWLRSEGVNYHTMAEVEAEGWARVATTVLREAARGPDKLFISFDMSVLDPAFAAAAGRPVANGLTPREVLPLLRRLCSENEIIGFELLDVAPYLDLSYRSALNANTILHTCLTGIAMRKRGLTQAGYLDSLATSHD